MLKLLTREDSESGNSKEFETFGIYGAWLTISVLYAFFVLTLK